MTTKEQLRQYLNAAAALVPALRDLEQARAVLDAAELEYRRRLNSMAELLCAVVDDGTMADDGRDGPPLHMRHLDYFIRVPEDWHEMDRAQLLRSIVVGRVPSPVPWIRDLLERT